jgi:hypothetical protein
MIRSFKKVVSSEAKDTTMNKQKFIETITASYQFKGESTLLGSAVMGEDYDTGVQVRLPLKTMNRHVYALFAG